MSIRVPTARNGKAVGRSAEGGFLWSLLLVLPSMSRGVTSVAHRLRANRRVSAIFAVAFVVGSVPLVLTFGITERFVVSRFLTWAGPVVPLLVLGTLDLLAAVFEMRSLPEYDDWGWEKRTRVWHTLVFERHYTLQIVVTLLYALALFGVFLVGPAGFPAVGVVVVWTTVLALPALTPYAFGSTEEAELDTLR